MPTAVLIYDDTPPSINSAKSGYRSHWRQGRETKKRWEGIFAMLLLKERVPKGRDYVRATGELRFPRNGRRDAGKFRVVLEKALGDALTTVGIIPDDDTTHYSFGDLTISNDRGEKGPARTTVQLEFE
jgi:hypothetical protein